MATDPYAQFATPVQQGPTPKQRATEANIQQSVTSTARGQADLPYLAPKAQTDLTDAQLKILRDLQQNARDELKTFEGLDTVKTYDQGMRYFATALSVPRGKEGDSDLVTLAAKVQDPTGAVMQGDIDRYNNLQVALDALPQWVRNQLNREGTFTPETRQKIIAFMRNRVNTYRLPYAETRRTFETRIGNFNALLPPGVNPVNPSDILPGDPLKLYAPKIEAYDKRLGADKIRAQREEGQRADVFAGLPEGAQYAGEPVQGFRFSPEAESEIVSYMHAPDATAEGYGNLIAEKAAAEKFISPDQRGAYAQGAAAQAVDFFNAPPEVRAQAEGLDYSTIDEQATKEAGLGAGLLQAARNVPESAAQMASGFGSAILNPVETAQTLTDPQAMLEMLKNRYGGMDAIKRTAITDPLGLAADASTVLSLGGAGLARVPGMTRFGRGVSTAGRVLDPFSLGIGAVTEGVPAAYQYARENAPGFTTGVQNLPSEIAGFPSGTGGAPLREAVGAGFERGMEGAPTPRTEAFTQGMRSPETTGDDLVSASRQAIANLRQQASNAYTSAMKQFGKNPVPLSIDVVRQRMLKIKPSSYDTWSDRKGPRPSEHVAWEQMNAFVEDYAAKAAEDPSLLMPLAMDQFKQDLFDVGSKLGGQYDRNASRIAGNAYNAVRQELVKHDPIYADTMRGYEQAAQEAKQLEASFGLAAARGKTPNIESSSRRLQAAIGRNNANVSYGQRAGQVERLNELDPEGTIVPTLAGATLSSWKPRGFNAAVTLGAGIPAALTNPFALLAAPAFMPRVMGEAAYGLGNVAGATARIGKGAAEALAPTAREVADLYNRYPAAVLGTAVAGSRADEAEAQRLRDAYLSGAVVAPAKTPDLDTISQFPVPKPAAPAAAPEAPAGESTITIRGRKARYDEATDKFIDVVTGEVVDEGDARYARGGRVRNGFAYALGG